MFLAEPMRFLSNNSFCISLDGSVRWARNSQRGMWLINIVVGTPRFELQTSWPVAEPGLVNHLYTQGLQDLLPKLKGGHPSLVTWAVPSDSYTSGMTSVSTQSQQVSSETLGSRTYPCSSDWGMVTMAWPWYYNHLQLHWLPKLWTLELRTAA